MSSYTTPPTQQSDNGASFRVIVSNGSGSITSSAAILTVTVSNAPTATITQPAAGTFYTAGMTVNIAGYWNRPRGWHAARERLHVASRFSPR